MLVFHSQVAKLHPIVQCGAGHRRIQQEEDIERPIARGGVVARYFTGVGLTGRTCKLEGWRQGSKPKLMELPKLNGTPSPELAAESLAACG